MLAFTRFTPAPDLANEAWTGPWVAPGFPFDRLIASWNADTPPGSHITVELQGTTSEGARTGWYVLGLWAFDDADFQRTSVRDQTDALGRVAVDTFLAVSPLGSYRLRVTSSGGAHGSPSVRMVSALATVGDATVARPSAPVAHRAVELIVPPYCQHVHADAYPELAGGGAAWCSPTATAMVVAYWDAGPTEADLAWIDPALADPQVVHAARFTYDHDYGGCGNWPFNTAYAARYGLDAFVTQLRSLREAESFADAGIPLVASIVAGPGELDGFALREGTAGHLVVIVGFTAEGDPIVNDPAADTNDTVRRVYDRAQFERAWVGGSGGVVYVITNPGTMLPPSEGNW